MVAPGFLKNPEATHRLGAVDQCSCMDANILVDSEV
jgi:hypothetical protein